MGVNPTMEVPHSRGMTLARPPYGLCWTEVEMTLGALRVPQRTLGGQNNSSTPTSCSLCISKGPRLLYPQCPGLFKSMRTYSDAPSMPHRPSW